ncbi:hypothetical protein [Terasakiella pusilla]|uniref:hypothetical protein n=1 Tax=Terasakiella pusilla TaxID=64973 RepID=UPI003AA84176
MGITLSALKNMQEMGYVESGVKFLDIGSSNLYSAHLKELREFLSAFKDVRNLSDEDIERLSKGSLYDPVKGGLNESFVGELLEWVNIDYQSFDIADGYKTKIFDLNKQEIDAEHFEKYDVVANFGTTEHLLNQMNAFGAIHDATKVGGVMIHEVPACGWIDHGYITYTARFFYDLATANKYEIDHLAFSGPLPGKKLYDSVHAFKSYFPSFEKTLKEAPEVLKEMQIPDISIFICLKKKKSGKFITSLETSTSVGDVYSGGGHGSGVDQVYLSQLQSEVYRLRREMDMIRNVASPLIWLLRKLRR